MISVDRTTVGYGAAVVLLAIASVLVFPEVWNTLLTVNGFIPHGHCYLWKPGLVWLHVTSDLLIGLAYVAISATLACLVYTTRREIPFHWMFLAFGSFIVACGGTHFMEIWTLWRPVYWFSGWLKVVTAIASVTTALILPALVPKALVLVNAAKLSEERRLHLELANQKLEALNEQLQQRDQLKTQFFANVSHELRTPLALILGPTEKLLKANDLNPEQQHDLEVIDRNAGLLLKQVNDLLDVSKVEAGRMPVNYSQVELAELVRLTAANFDGLAQEKQITFTVETPDFLLGQLDAAKVQRILLNLLANAFKFTPNGGRIHCTLTVQDAMKDAIAPNQTASTRYAVLTVQDSGPGVPIALRSQIFDRFSQGDSGTTRRFGGTGLGLAIVKEFVDLQSGTIAVGDAPIGGAEFTVELLLTAPAGVTVAASPTQVDELEMMGNLVVEELRAVAAATSTAIPDQSAEQPLVLVVEDNPEMNRFITATLATRYRTATALNGQAGLEQAIELRPDLIISDVMMPCLSGEQLVQQARSQPELDQVPIIILTAKTDDELRVRLLRQGAQDYLMKPFSVEELQARVGNLIAIKRVRDRLQAELESQSHDVEVLADEVSLRRRELQIAMNALQQQAEELEQANRLKDEFLAIVSHELRTPLNAILGWSQALRARTFDAATTDRALETIERNARLQTQLIENLLDISRLLRGKLLLNMQFVDLLVVIRSAIGTVQSEFDRKNIQLTTQLNDQIAPISGDPARLQQIFENLLSNAVKFTPAGGKVGICLEQAHDEAIIQVSDTGQGIPAEFLPYMFDYFRQADGSLTRKHGGLGVGLAIVRQLVELHNGQIQVESAGEGQGATFTVTLPIKMTIAPPPYLSERRT